MAERRRNRAGFTLFEVLGAVAILGISYTLLATVAIQGARAIGESQRRLAASLIADEQLAEIELAAELGQLIELRDDEFEQEPFLIRVEVLDSAELYTADPGEEPRDLMSFLATEAEVSLPQREANWLLGYLREVHVSVRWEEGANEVEVRRTAFIYDQQAWMDDNGEAVAERNEASQIDAQADDQAGDSTPDNDDPGSQDDDS
ncbi:MAG: hypothetical protein GY733_15205 [bacterium]|nr:hypothetical protein [bacterium]